MNNKYHTLCCVYLEDCICIWKVQRQFLMQLKTLGRESALGGLDTFNSASTSKTTDDSKPSVPFMAVKEYRPKVTTEDTLRVVYRIHTGNSV